MSLAAGLLGDDEDGVPYIARLPMQTLMGGIPIPVGDDDVFTVPVGFGINKALWGVGANLWMVTNGYQTTDDALKNMVGIIMDNTLPTQPASGKMMVENPVAGLMLSSVPFVLKPMAEIAFNRKAWSGSKIYRNDTPRDQLAHEQDDLGVPDAYKGWAKFLYDTTGQDVRPETLQHLTESYMWGAAGAIPKSLLQDNAEKTLENRKRKGEIFGTFLTAMGADISVHTNALEDARRTYALADLRYRLHKHWRVGETHTDEQYAQYADRNKNGNPKREPIVVTERRLRERGAPEAVIRYVTSGMKFDKKRKALEKERRKLSKQYYDLRKEGKEYLALRLATQRVYDELAALNAQYIRENNHAYFELQQSL